MLKEQRAYYCRNHLQSDPQICGPGHFAVGQEGYSIGRLFKGRERKHASYLKVFPNSKQKHTPKPFTFYFEIIEDLQKSCKNVLRNHVFSLPRFPEY